MSEQEILNLREWAGTASEPITLYIQGARFWWRLLTSEQKRQHMAEATWEDVCDRVRGEQMGIQRQSVMYWRKKVGGLLYQQSGAAEKTLVGDE